MRQELENSDKNEKKNCFQQIQELYSFAEYLTKGNEKVFYALFICLAIMWTEIWLKHIVL